MERDAAEAFEGVRVEYEEAISAERAAEQARWWQSDRAAKYSWAALQRTELPGWSVVDGQLIETSAVKSGSQSRPAMLSDYWAEEAGALIEAPDKTKWTRVHCPLVWDGKPTEKAGWDDAKRLELANAVSAKLQSAGETQFHRGWMDPRIDGADRRAQLQGTVLFAAPKAPSGKRTSATFEDAAFCGEANFIGHTFAPNVNFSRALFAGIASFHKCAFKGRAEFAGALFLNYASFDRAHFIGEAKFEAASFHGDAIFKDALIRSGGSFRDASFFGVAPFQGARLHADTSFDSVRVSPLERALRTSSEVFWAILAFAALLLFVAVSVEPNTAFWVEALAALFAAAALFWSARGGDVLIGDHTLERHVRAFRQLTSLCEQTRNRRGSAVFYQLELKAMRLRPTTNPFERFASWLYDWAAGYGESLWRPVASLLLLTLACAAAFNFDAAAANFVHALWFSILNVVKPGHVWAADFVKAQTEQSTHPYWAWVCEHFGGQTSVATQLARRLAATLQTIASLTLVFLFGLALRRRFQI